MYTTIYLFLTKNISHYSILANIILCRRDISYLPLVATATCVGETQRHARQARFDWSEGKPAGVSVACNTVFHHTLIKRGAVSVFVKYSLTTAERCFLIQIKNIKKYPASRRKRHWRLSRIPPVLL